MPLIQRGEEGKALGDSIMIETDLFEHREKKPHFINPCCFGEDFAAWLKEQLTPLVDSGFSFSDPIQEDYGWGFWARRGKDPLGFAGSGQNFYAYVFNSPTNLVDPLGLAAPALVPAIFGGLTLIQGGGGAAAISGTVVETGSVGGPLGVGIEATGAIIYFGASASNAEMNANAAYDEEWQSVAAYNEAMIVHPRPPALAGRYTQRDLDWQEYKNRCDTPEPPGLGACTERIMKVQRKIDCRDMRWTWDQKYDPSRHANDINNLSKGIQKDQDWIEKNCK